MGKTTARDKTAKRKTTARDKTTKRKTAANYFYNTKATTAKQSIMDRKK